MSQFSVPLLGDLSTEEGACKIVSLVSYDTTDWETLLKQEEVAETEGSKRITTWYVTQEGTSAYVYDASGQQSQNATLIGSTVQHKLYEKKLGFLCADNVWLKLSDGTGFMRIADDKGTMLLLEKPDAIVLAPHWDQIKKETYGSFLKTSDFQRLGQTIELINWEDALSPCHIVEIEDETVVVKCGESTLVRMHPYQFQCFSWLAERKDFNVFCKVRMRMTILWICGVIATPVFIWMGWIGKAKEGKMCISFLYSVVFFFTVNVAFLFNGAKASSVEQITWLRLIGKPFRIPYFQYSARFPAVCITAISAIPAYTDHLILSLAIGTTHRLWGEHSDLQNLWDGSWESVPLFCFVMRFLSLPVILGVLMIVDQSVQAIVFVRSNRAYSETEWSQLEEPYEHLANPASVASLLFLAQLFSMSSQRAVPGHVPDYNSSQTKAKTARFLVKVCFGTQLRLWFKISLLILMLRAGVFQGNPFNDSGERTLLLAIMMSFLHAATGSMPLFVWFVARMFSDYTYQSDSALQYVVTMVEITPGQVEPNIQELVSYALFASRKKRLMMCCAWIVITFPMWGSAIRLSGAYLCASHNFAFTSFGCVTTSTDLTLN